MEILDRQNTDIDLYMSLGTKINIEWVEINLPLWYSESPGGQPC